MLERASGSLPNYPGDPPAAAGGLGSAGTRSHSGPSEAARLRRTAAACSKRYDPLFRHDVKGADGLGSPGYQTGTVRASTGRVWTGDVAELRGSWETAKFHTVDDARPRGGSLVEIGGRSRTFSFAVLDV